MIGHFICFHQINKRNVRGKVVILPHGKERHQYEKAVAASKCRCASKLKASAMLFKEFECAPVHDRAKDLEAYVHEHDASPLVGIGEISALGDTYTLASIQLVMIGVTHNEVIVMIVDMAKVGGGHGLECLWRYTNKSRCFGIFQFLDCFAKLFPGDWVIEFPHGAALRDLGKESGISGSFGIIYLVKVRGKHRHVFRCVGST